MERILKWNIMCSVLQVMYSEVFGKGNFSHSCLEDLAPGTENKKSSSACVHRGHCLFWLIRKQVFFSKLGSNMKLGLKYALEERKGQANGSSSPREKFSSFPDFITPLTAIES